MDTVEDHDLKSASENDSDNETVDYSKSKPDETEKEDENMSTASSHDCASHESSSSDSSSDEETDERGNKIYKKADLEIVKFIVDHPGASWPLGHTE